MKNTLLVTIVSILFCIQATAAVDGWPSEQTPEKLTSRSVLSKYMENPIANEIYQFAQLEKVGTVLDFRMYKIFNYEDPDISAKTLFIKQAMAEMMRIQLAQDRLRNTLVTAETNKAVYELVAEAMRNTGFSETQIKKARIYIAFGEVNAHTYGFDKDNVVIVINDKLLKMASPKEIQAIVTHELGHIIGQHVIAGMQLAMMLSRIAKTAMGGKGGVEQDLSPELQGKINGLFEDIQTHNLTEYFGMNDVVARKQAKAMVQNLRASMGGLMAAQGQMEEEEIIQHSRRFLLEVVRGTNTMEFPQSSKDFLTFLANILGTSIRPNEKDMAEHFSILARALSREREMTADLLAVSGVDPYISVRFEMAVGGGSGLPEKPTRKDVQNAIARLQSELDSTVGDTTKEELADMLATHGTDHPEVNIRAVNQVLFSRNYQVLAMRNPFLRDIILRDKLVARQNMFLGMAKKLMVDPKAEQQVKMFAAKAAELEKIIKPLSEDIFNLITDLGLDKVNPRLNDLIEYRLNDREFGLALVDYFSEMLKAVEGDKFQTEYLTQKVEKLKAELAQPDDLAIGLSGLLDMNKKYVKRLQLVNSQPDVKTIRETRTAMRKEQKAENRNSRADMDLSINVRKSSGLHSTAIHMDQTKPAGTSMPFGALGCIPSLRKLAAQ